MMTAALNEMNANENRSLFLSEEGSAPCAKGSVHVDNVGVYVDVAEVAASRNGAAKGFQVATSHSWRRAEPMLP